jgi:hypothetical protein
MRRRLWVSLEEVIEKWVRPSNGLSRNTLLPHNKDCIATSEKPRFYETICADTPYICCGDHVHVSVDCDFDA